MKKEPKHSLAVVPEPVETCTNHGANGDFTERYLAPGEEFYPKWKRKVNKVMSIFGKTICEHTEFVAKDHSTLFTCNQCGEAFLEENTPSPELIKTCEEVMDRHLRRSIETNTKKVYPTNVLMQDPEGKEVMVDLNEIEEHLASNGVRDYSTHELRTMIASLIKINPESEAVQYIESVNILTNNKYDRSYILDLVEGVMDMEGH
jgi:hypothetical protein